MSFPSGLWDLPGGNGAAWKTRGLPRTRASRGLFIPVSPPYMQTPHTNTAPGFPALFTKNVFCICISEGQNSLPSFPFSSVLGFPKGTNLTWRIGFEVKEQTHPLPSNYIFKTTPFARMDKQEMNKI